MKQVSLFLLILTLVSCSSKNKDGNEEENAFFPVYAFLQAQAKDVDTGLYRITVTEMIDTSSNTTFIKREDFRRYANDFLDLDDISDEDWNERYKESSIFDEDMDKTILTYTANEEDAEVRSLDVVLGPNNKRGFNDVESIVIRKEQNNGDSSVSGTMVWYVNKRFTVVKKILKTRGPELLRKTEVVWNDHRE